MKNKSGIVGSSSDSDSGLQVFKMSALTTHIETEVDWKSQDRTAITLHQSPGLHITLIAMHAGTEKPWHTVECPISLQVLQGSVDFVTDAETVALKGGDLLVLRGGIRHHMRVKEASVVLLSLGTLPG